MTNRKTYRIFEKDERELVYEAVLNDHGQIVAYKNYQSPTQLFGVFRFQTGNGRQELSSVGKSISIAQRYP